jgi:mitochondrial fission protein ELM1
LLALAEALKLPFETRTLRLNVLRALRAFRGATLISLDRAGRNSLTPPWPDLVIGIGWRTVSVARWIKRQSGGRTRLVRLGDPRVNAALFDLIITTPQYPVREAPNVLRLPLGMSRFRQAPVATEAERAFLGGLPRPHRLLAIGGIAKYWQLTAERVQSAADRLLGRSGTVIAVTSPRTPADIVAALEGMGPENLRIVTGREPRFPVLLADADEIFVTGDSIAMLSEAVLTGKPVGIIPIELSKLGERKLGSDGGRHRDLRRFWASLRDKGLAGTVEAPLAGHLADPAETAADAVKALLGDLVE